MDCQCEYLDRAIERRFPQVVDQEQLNLALDAYDTRRCGIHLPAAESKQKAIRVKSSRQGYSVTLLVTHVLLRVLSKT
jgi:hypothetical protein